MNPFYLEGSRFLYPRKYPFNFVEQNTARKQKSEIQDLNSAFLNIRKQLILTFISRFLNLNFFKVLSSYKPRHVPSKTAFMFQILTSMLLLRGLLPTSLSPIAQYWKTRFEKIEKSTPKPQNGLFYYFYQVIQYILM